MRLDRGLLLGLVALLLVLSTALIRPYLQFVLAAVVLAFVLQPLQRRLAPRIGDTPAAIALLVASVVAIVFPFFLVMAFVATDVTRYAEEFEGWDFYFARAEELIATFTGQNVDLVAAVQTSSQEIGQRLFGGVMSAFGTAVHLLLGIGLLLFLLFFFVRDGERLVAWIRDVSPLTASVTDDLLDRLDAITRAVLIGHVLIAIIQGAVAGVGLFLTGIPNATFWTVVMILLGLIPLIGTFVIWAPASVYLVGGGNAAAGIALFVYGFIVVGITDDYLRPVIVDRYARVSPGVIIVGVVGGLSVFGFMGLFVGPIVIGALKETIDVYDEHYGLQRGTSGG